MSRTRRIFVIASLIVFGLLAPAPSKANLSHCTGPWSGSGDTVVSTCSFEVGGPALELSGFAVAAPMAKIEIELLNPLMPPTQQLVAKCSGGGTGLATCQHVDSTQLQIRTVLICKVYGVAVAGVYSCRTV